MILHDVNVLVYVYREDTDDHDRFRESFDEVVGSPTAFGYSNLILSGFIRVVTNPRVFAVPTHTRDALEFTEAVRGQPNAVEIRPGNRHWEIFVALCANNGIKGNLVADAYHAALAIEAGAEFLTTDGDFARFPGLKWRHPLAHN